MELRPIPGAVITAEFQAYLSAVEVYKARCAAHPEWFARCNNLPDCPCDCCYEFRQDIAEGKSEGQVKAQKKAEWLERCRQEEETKSQPQRSRLPL